MSVYCAIGCRKIGRYPKRVQDGPSQDLLKYQPDTDAQMLAESEGLRPFRFTLGRRFPIFPKRQCIAAMQDKQS